MQIHGPSLSKVKYIVKKVYCHNLVSQKNEDIQDTLFGSFLT